MPICPDPSPSLFYPNILQHVCNDLFIMTFISLLLLVLSCFVSWFTFFSCVRSTTRRSRKTGNEACMASLWLVLCLVLLVSFLVLCLVSVSSLVWDQMCLLTDRQWIRSLCLYYLLSCLWPCLFSICFLVWDQMCNLTNRHGTRPGSLHRLVSCLSPCLVSVTSFVWYQMCFWQTYRDKIKVMYYNKLLFGNFIMFAFRQKLFLEENKVKNIS